MPKEMITTTRRQLFELLAGGVSAASLWPEVASAQARRDVLVLGMDISDAVNYDPATGSAYTPPAVVRMAYDTLVTMTPGDYVTVKPALATAWERTPDGNGWRFSLREGVKFNSGQLMTADDVKWSLERVINIQGQPSQYIANVAGVSVVGPSEIDVILKNPSRSTLEILCASSFVVYERRVLEAHQGLATRDAPTNDRATTWLNQNSCGTGSYTLTAWERNTSVVFDRNPYCWRGVPPFRRIIIRHLSDPSAQLLAVERGDIDVAFNLVPEQIATARAAKGVRVDQLRSLDQVYLALTASPSFNKALSIREARQAIGWAIDYEGIKLNLLDGAAEHPASILPIGTLGSTQELAERIGFKQDLDRAKALLAKANLPDGFSFKLSYGTSLIAGVSYEVLAQKVQSDLARVGIKADLDPLDAVTLRTQFVNSRLSSCIAFWGVAGVDNWIWAMAAIERLAARMNYTPPNDLVQLMNQAADSTDQEEKERLWIEFQRRMAEEAYLLVLFQPVYQIAIGQRLRSFPLNAAGWQADIDAAA